MNPIVIEALTVLAPGGQVRVLLAEHGLDFDPADVLAFEALPDPPGLRPGSAVLARLSLRPGAALLRMVPTRPYDAQLWAWREPFLYATRTDRSVEGNFEMAARERAFFSARGLSVDMLRGPQAGHAPGAAA